MPTLPVLKARGLHTSDNQLSAVPDGAMVRAENVVISAQDIVEPRRGQKYEDYSFGSGDKAKALAFFRGGKVIQYGASSLAQSTLTIVGAGHALDANTAALWRFNDTTATALVEEKGLYPGASSTGTPTVVTGVIGNGRFLNAASLTTTGATDAFRGLFNSANAWTVEWWMRIDNWGSSVEFRPIMSMGTGLNADVLALSISASNSGCIIAGNSIAGSQTVGSSFSGVVGTWRHYAIQRVDLGTDFGSVRYKLWVNGVYNSISNTLGPTAQPLTGQQMKFGLMGDNGMWLRDPALYIDDVRISSVVRTDAEILESYQRGFTGSTTGYTTIAGSYAPVDPALLRMKFVEMAENLYLNTSLGLYAMESLTATPFAAGIPRGVSTSAVVSTAGGSFLPSDSAAAYSHVWGKKDASGNVKLGAPSPVTIARNHPFSSAAAGIIRTAADGAHPAGKVTVTYAKNLFSGTPQVGESLTLVTGEANFAAGAKVVVQTAAINDVSGTFTYNEAGANVSSSVAQTFTASRGADVSADLPAGVTAASGHFVRFYRSRIVAGASATPGLDLFQLVEKSYLGGATNSFTDNVPDIMLEGAPPLYTSPNFGEGALSANERPPLAKDIFEFDGRLWFANTTERQRFFLNLLGIGSPNGVQDGDTITIGGLTYTFRLVVGPGDVRIETAGSVSENIEKTAKYLRTEINVNASNTTVTAHYVSGIDDAPGRLLLEERAIGGGTFAVSCSRIGSWFPALPTSGSTITSDNSRRAHGLSFSKVGEPEAVPITNYLADIPRGREVIRGIPLRDKAFILVKDVGFYILSGPAPYRLTKLDTTAKPLAPDTFVEHSNQIIGLTDQGVVSISEGGIRILSSPIELDLVDEVSFVGAAGLRLNAFAVSYESDRQFQLWLPDLSASTSCSHAFVYNSLRNAWTRWTGNRTCGGVNPADGMLYMGDGATNKLRVERKDYAPTDHADETLAVNVTGLGGDGLSATLASVAGVAVGDLLSNSSGSVQKLITAINGSVLTLALADNGSVPSGSSCYVLKAIACDVKFSPARTGDPAVLKQSREVCLHFARFYAKSMPVYFDSEMGHVETTGKTLTADGGAPYGVPGTPPAAALLSTNKRSEVPIEHQRCTQLQLGFRITEAWAHWRLNGYSLTFESISEKSVR